MLDDARKKFINADTEIRQESIERLWDGRERIRTVEDPTNEKSLYRLSWIKHPPILIRDLWQEEEARTFISDICMVDYLLYRLFAFIQMLVSPRESTQQFAARKRKKPRPKGNTFALQE